MPDTSNVILSTNEIKEISKLLVNRIFGENPSDASITKIDRDLIDTKINATMLEIEDAINARVEGSIDGAITRLMDSGEEGTWW